ncbi:hypothetical protein [uncultured Sphingomonas sp.]|uniref:hypothetical protein n=1 Tax=uncultured Sphingomonas sp. TaxID=158754 RepID=UPI0035CA68E1
MAGAADEGNRADILLMTATITPDNSPELARTDPALRLDDYRQALLFYIGRLGSSIDGIVFVENSDSDVSSLVALAKAEGVDDRVEFIANYGKHSYPGRDRSYGETRLLDHAMATSRLIAAADDRAVIWKITGRYRVRNLARMVRTAPRRFDLYCDVRNRPIAWLDLRFMAWTKGGYDRLLSGIADRLGTDPREPVMHRYVTGLKDAAVVRRYRTEPLVDGVRGWDNRHYALGRARLKFWVRAASRRLLPFLWI